MKNLLLIFLVGLPLTTLASDVIKSTETLNTAVVNSIAQSTNYESSKLWNMSDNEWGKYQNLMLGMSGLYYKNLSPFAVLGIHSDNEEDLNHYAELAARFEHEKLDKELRFNLAFQKQAARIYVAEPIIKPFDISAFNPKQK